MLRTGDIYKMLRDEIIQGKLNRGGRIVENDLCEGLGLSRGYDRVALKLLRMDGFVIFNHGRDAMVAGTCYGEAGNRRIVAGLKLVCERPPFNDSEIKDRLRKDTVTSMPGVRPRVEINLVASVW